MDAMFPLQRQFRQARRAPFFVYRKIKEKGLQGCAKGLKRRMTHAARSLGDSLKRVWHAPRSLFGLSAVGFTRYCRWPTVKLPRFGIRDSRLTSLQCWTWTLYPR